MDYGRKMVMIPVEQAARLNFGAQLESQGPQQHLNTYQQNLASILADTSLPPDVRAKHYGQEFSRLKSFKNSQTQKPIEFPIIKPPQQPAAPVQPVQPAQPAQPLSQLPFEDNHLLSSVPRKKVPAARLLLQCIKSNPDLGWTPDGKLVYQGQIIDQSNLLDTVNYLSRDLRREPDAATKIVVKSLLSRNAPQTAIGNTKMRRALVVGSRTAPPALSHIQDQEDEDDEFHTPVASPAKKNRRRFLPIRSGRVKKVKFVQLYK